MPEAWNFFEKFWNKSRVHSDDVIDRILNKLHDYVKTKIHKPSRKSYYHYQRHNIEICEANLERIINFLNNVDNDHDKEFLKQFPKWKKCRGETIFKLDKIMKSWKTERVVVNASRITGSAIGIAGGAALIASASLLVLPVGLIGGAAVATGLAIGGGVATVANGGTQIGAAITECVLLKSHMTEVKMLLDKDKEESHVMEKWFTHSKMLIDCLNEIIDFDILEALFEELVTLLNKTSADCLTNLFDKFFQNTTYKVILPEEYEVAMTGNVLGLFLIHRNNRILLGCNAAKHLISAYKGIEIAINAISIGVAVGAHAGCAAQCAAGCFGTFAAIGIVADATNIVLSAIDLSKGSNSRGAETLKVVSSALSEEQNVLEEVRNKLVRIIANKEILNVKEKFMKHRTTQQTNFCKNIIAKCTHIMAEFDEAETNRGTMADNFTFQTFLKQKLEQNDLLIEKLKRQKEQWSKSIYFTENYFMNAIKAGVRIRMEELGKEYHRFSDVDYIEKDGVYREVMIWIDRSICWCKYDDFNAAEYFLEKEMRRIEEARESSQNDALESLFWSSQISSHRS